MPKVLNKVFIQIYLFYVFTDYQADQAKPASIYYVPTSLNKHPVLKTNATVVSLFSITSHNAIDADNHSLNSPFTEEDLKEAIDKLKNGKASGLDQITNEFLKYSPPSLISIILRLFNILETDIVPSEWTIGVIIPIYKKKGSMDDPDNY